MKLELKANELSQASTPTPSSPQDIHVVSGNNKIVVSNKNLFDGLLRQGNQNGTSSSSRVFMNQNDFYINEGDVITFSTDLDTTIYSYSFYIYKNPYLTPDNTQLYTSDYQTTSSFTLIAGYTGYLGFAIKKIAGGDITPSNFSNNKFQIETGNTATAYLEHEKNSRIITLGDIELCKIGNYKDEFIRNNGKNLFDKDNATYSADNYIKNNNGEETYNAGSGYTTSYIKVQPNTTYTISGKITTSNLGARIYYYTSNKTWISRSNSFSGDNSNFAFTTPNNCEYIQFSYVISNYDNTTVQIEKGARTDYEPYGTGNWYIKKNIGKKVLNGTETWSNMGWGSKFAGRTSLDNAKLFGQNDNANLKSNYFASTSVGSLYSQTDPYGIAMRANSSEVVIRYDDATDTTGLQTWLSTHNTTVYYILATPTYTQITGDLENQLEEYYQSYDKQTNINQTPNDLPFIINAIAYIDTMEGRYESNQTQLQNELKNYYDKSAIDTLLSDKVEIFNTLADMKANTTLENGNIVHTTGYYEYNDGGGAYYKVRTKTNDDTADDMYLIALNNNTLIAELIIINNELNIKQVGVKGLVSVDDTSKIRTACQKTFDVYFPAGTYYLNGQLIITNADNKTIRGDGIQKTIFKAANWQTASHDDQSSYITNSALTTTHDFTLRDFSINAGNQAIDRYVLTVYNTTNLKLDNIEIYNGLGYATRFNNSQNIVANNLYIHDCRGGTVSGTNKVGGGFYGTNMKNVQVTNSRFENIGDHAFYLNGEGATSDLYSENIQISNVIMKNIGLDGYTAGGAITVYGKTKNVEVTNCIFDGAAQGIHISNHGVQYTDTPKNITINNCVIKNSTDTGIFIGGLEADFASDITITNNVINTCGNDGLSVRQCQNSVFSNNTIQSCGRYGILLSNTDYSIVNNNVLKDNKNQLWVGGFSGTTHNKNNTIANNTIYCTTAYKSTNNSGVYVANTATDTILVANNSFNNHGYNMYVRGTGNKGILQDGVSSENNFTRKIIYRDSIPSGNMEGDVGDICFNSSPSANGKIGWVCTVAGSPGTWKEFGNISN